MIDNDCCTLNYCGANRPFEMRIVDNTGREVMHLSRPWRPWNAPLCVCACLGQQVEVQAPPGVPIGLVRQRCTICTPCFNVYDQNDRVQLRIDGPCCRSNCCGDVVFQVNTKDGRKGLGTIKKQVPLKRISISPSLAFLHSYLFLICATPYSP